MPRCAAPTTTDGRVYTLTDTVGFVRNLPHQLVEAFRSTLEEVGDSDVIVHVVDAAHPDPAAQLATVRDVIGDVGARDIPEIVVFNKADLVDDDTRLVLRGLEPSAIFASSRTGEGIDELRAAIDADAARPGVEVDRSCRTTAATSSPRCTSAAACSSTEYVGGRHARPRARVSPEFAAQLAEFRGIRDRADRPRPIGALAADRHRRAVTSRHTLSDPRARRSSLAIVGDRPDDRRDLERQPSPAPARDDHPPYGRGTRPRAPRPTGTLRGATMAATDSHDRRHRLSPAVLVRAVPAANGCRGARPRPNDRPPRRGRPGVHLGHLRRGRLHAATARSTVLRYILENTDVEPMAHLTCVGIIVRRGEPRSSASSWMPASRASSPCAATRPPASPTATRSSATSTARPSSCSSSTGCRQERAPYTRGGRSPACPGAAQRASRRDQSRHRRRGVPERASALRGIRTQDIDALLAKQAAGATLAITQLFFHADDYLGVRRARPRGRRDDPDPARHHAGHDARAPAPRAASSPARSCPPSSRSPSRSSPTPRGSTRSAVAYAAALAAEVVAGGAPGRPPLHLQPPRGRARGAPRRRSTRITDRSPREEHRR